ncbi:MAG: hypothetical protein JNL38_28855 [Myxococcales bacterium]|nr:hypothetical protein [Myxococcales bacterium]
MGHGRTVGLASLSLVGALLATLPAHPGVALAYDDGKCPAAPPVPKGHLVTPWSIGVVNTSTNPPEIEVFFDKGAGDGVQAGDLAYAVDCRGNVLPRTVAPIASSSKSGSHAAMVIPRHHLPAGTTFVIDVTHGAVGLPPIAGAPGVGASHNAVKGPNIAKYQHPSLSFDSPRAYVSQSLQLGSVGYVVHPLEERVQATFVVDEWTRTGSSLRLTRTPWAANAPDALSWLIVYPTVCTFPNATPDLKKRSPPGHVFPKITRVDPTPDKKFMVTFDQGARGGIVAGSKVYLVDRGAIDPKVPLSIERIDATSVTILSPYSRAGVAGKVLFQTAQCN